MDPHISVKDIHNNDIHSVKAISYDEGDTHSVKIINDDYKQILTVSRPSAILSIRVSSLLSMAVSPPTAST